MVELNDAVRDAKRRAVKVARRRELELAGIIILASALAYGGMQLVAMLIIAAVTSAGESIAVALILIIAVNLVTLAAVALALQNLLPPWFERRQLRRIIRGES